VLGLSGSPSDGGTAHIQPARAGNAASAAASTITDKYKDQSTKERSALSWWACTALCGSE
jgi:hypothetical protein